MIEAATTWLLLDELRRGARQSIAARRELQSRLLRTAVRLAYVRVPFYRRVWAAAGLDPEQVCSIDDLERLPIISSAALRRAAAAGELLARSAGAVSRAFPTSGTSGAVLQVPRGTAEARVWRAAGLRMLFEHGFSWRDATVQFDTAPAPPHLLQRLGVARTTWIDPGAPPDEQLARLAAADAKFIFGAPTVLRRCLRALTQRGARVRPPRAVFCHSEILDAETRAAIRGAFNTDPINVYGMTEVGYIGWQCEQRAALHVNAELLAVEVRGEHRPAAPGEMGRVVITDLRGRTMPLLRCDTGDLATVRTEPCGCALTLPTLGAIEGRTDHLIHLDDGRVVTPRRVIDHLAGTLRIDGYRLRQAGAREFRLTMAPDACAPGSDEMHVRRRLCGLLGNVDIQIDVGAVPPSNGKTQAVIGNGVQRGGSVGTETTGQGHDSLRP